MTFLDGFFFDFTYEKQARKDSNGDYGTLQVQAKDSNCTHGGAGAARILRISHKYHSFSIIVTLNSDRMSCH